MNYYEIYGLKDLVKYKDDEFDKKIILKDDKKMLLLFALKENQFIGTHISETDAIITVLEGEVKFDLFDEDKKDKILKTGDVLKFEKMEKHSVIALKNSKFSVIRI